jgi:hypothetical protein
MISFSREFTGTIFFVVATLFLGFPLRAPAQSLVISEFMASNQDTLDDEDGDSEDWIEIFNQSGVAVNLDGWFLTDNAAELTKWAFPSLVLNPGEQLLVFASNKDRRDPAAQLHTNFKLTSSGEFLALLRPNGTTVEHSYTPAFPLQVQDVSFGLQQSTTSATLLAPGAAVKYKVPANGNDDVEEGNNPNSWIGTNFPDSSWANGTTGVGYATGSPDAYDALINTDVQSLMWTSKTTIYIRIPFNVADPSAISGLTLKMKYDDGFVAYLNGNPLSIAEENAPTPDSLDYLANATANHSDSQSVNYQLFPVSSSLLNVGANVLCIHGLNRGSSSSDILFVPELESTSVTGTGTPSYFTGPTPNAPNSGGVSTPGPLIRSVTKDLPPILLNSVSPPVVADSAAEFSGTQEQNGWVYGYHQGGGVYNPDTSFTAFKGGTGQGSWNGTSQLWTGSHWDLQTASTAPWTSIGATNVHPNDSNPGPEQATVRRWVSDVSGLHTLTGTFHNLNPSGDGTTGRVFHEGTEIFAQVTDGGPVAFSIPRSLSIGDRIDLMVDTGSFDQDGSDGTDQTAIFYQGSLSTNSLVIEAEVVPTINPINTVTLSWRVMYETNQTLTMVDDGSGDDATAGDGIYSATISTSTLSEGEMIRWKVTATDTGGGTSTQPQFPDPLDSPEYFGTITDDPSVASSSLTIFHWFTSNPGGANTTSGSRGSVYYLGQFYDNIQADRHGQSTGGFPKKSYDFDFNKSDRFRYKDGETRVKDINMLTNWADKSKTRNTLGYEIIRNTGHPGHFAFPVRIQQNAAFFNTADLVEDGDDRYLERVGLDGEGALYKMYNRLDSSSSGVNKKTRKNENNSDLSTLVSGLGQSGEAKLRYGYDNVNIPGTINYLAALDMTNNRDHGHKNYYVYRDTNGTREWRPLVWDIDLCLGRNWRSGPSYFDDVFRNNPLRDGPSNRLKTLIFDDATLNQMYLRRMRSIIDEQIGSPASPVNYLATRVNELVALIDPANDNPNSGSDDADLDWQKWGSWGNNNAMRPAADRIVFEHLPSRRRQLAGIGELPSSQPVAPTINIGTIDYNPSTSGASADQSGEYFTLTNPNGFAVDLSDWVISGSISMTLPPGAVIPAGGTLYVAREAVGFRARNVSPKANEKRYLISGYGGQLSARGETITLTDDAANLIASVTYGGAATRAQNYLRITEILYAPTAPTAGELASISTLSGSDFEFVELTNTGPSPLVISGAQFVAGITFTFPTPTTLNPGAHILVVANEAAFALRNGAGLNIAGEYVGKLSNDGEQLQILDAVGENILEFSYNDVWYDPTADKGYSLVMLDPTNTPVPDFDRPENWGISLAVGGDPGTASSATSMTFVSWKYQEFTPAEFEDPLVTGPNLDLDGDDLNLVLEFGFGRDPQVAETMKNYTTSIVNDGGTDYFAFTFRRQKNALDVTYVVEISNDLVAWTTVTTMVGPPIDNGDSTESITVRDSAPTNVQSRRFARLSVVIGP